MIVEIPYSFVVPKDISRTINSYDNQATHIIVYHTTTPIICNREIGHPFCL